MSDHFRKHSIEVAHFRLTGALTSIMQQSAASKQAGRAYGSDYLPIDKEVFMNRYIAHAAHLRPRQFGMAFDEIRRYPLNLVHGFGNDLDVADNRVLNLPVFLKCFNVCKRPKVFRRSVNGFRNVFR